MLRYNSIEVVNPGISGRIRCTEGCKMLTVSLHRGKKIKEIGDYHLS